MIPPQAKPAFAHGRVPLRLALLSVLGALFLAILPASPAAAGELHAFSHSFGSPGPGSGQLALTYNSSVAVNRETGNLYVTDSGNARVEEFEADGTFVRTFGTLANPTFIAIDNSAGASKGDVYVADFGDNSISKFEADGTPVTSWGTSGKLSGFGEIAGFAVDSSGDLWVYNHSAQMREYGPLGNLITEWNSGLSVDPLGIAVDSSGNLYVLLGNGETAKLDSSGATLNAEIDRCCPTSVVVDPSTDDLYIAHDTGGSPEIVGYNSASTRLESFGAENIVPRPAGVAVGPNQIVYLADTDAQKILSFGLVPAFSLTVTNTYSGSASGKVVSKPGGIDCGATCTSEFAEGRTVILTAQPEIGTTFVGWTGCKAEPEGRCEVEMSGAKSVEAKFKATAGHAFVNTIAGVGSTALSGPTEIAVDQTTHDIYVNDPGHRRIEKFDSAGNFLLMFGGEVDQTTGGNVCPEHAGDVCGTGVPGPGPGQFVEPTYIAVDNSGGPSNGDIYVGDPNTELVQKFASNGHIVSSWGVAGQKNGSDQEEGPIHGINGMDVGPTGDLFLSSAPCCGYLFVWAQNGDPAQFTFTNPQGGARTVFKVDPSSNEYFYQSGAGSEGRVTKNENTHSEARTFFIGPITSVGLATGFAFDPGEKSLYESVEGNDIRGPGVEQYSPECQPTEKEPPLCEPVDAFGAGHLFGARGVGIDGSDATVYAVNSETNDIAVFEDIRPQVTTGPPVAVTETSATLAGNVDPETHGKNHGPITECRLEYGLSKSYGNSVPCDPDPETGSPFSGATAVTATISGLTPIADLPIGTEYHYRFVVSNEAGAGRIGADRTVKTAAPPRIEGASSSHLTATSADLEASINPNGLVTPYTFEYGTTPDYGKSVSGEITGSVVDLSHRQTVTVHVEGLQPGVTYHFRVLAHNSLSSSDEISEDQTFEFFPPNCPNSAVRQQTGAVFLPDCRGYELVSPKSANATLFFPGGPNSDQAASPARFSFTGNFSAIPGVNPMVTAGDLYVSTRTGSGWTTKYIGLPGDQAGCMGGPPTDLRTHPGDHPSETRNNAVLTDPSMGQFLDFLNGTPIQCVLGSNFVDAGPEANLTAPSNAPFLWNADGVLERRLFEGSTNILEDLKCPYLAGHSSPSGMCTGETAASGDLTHLVFSSAKRSFSEPGEPAGLTTAPGSAYDMDMATGKISLISTLPTALGGGPIPQDPNFASVEGDLNEGISNGRETGGKEEFIRFPAISTDGSHILMSTATELVPDSCGTEVNICKRYVDDPRHLYMRVQNGESGETYEIAEDAATEEPTPVRYVGMTPDGTKVFFMSEKHLTNEFEEHGGDSLYMWSVTKAENGEDPVTLISKGESESPAAPGNVSNCEPSIAHVSNEFSNLPDVPWSTSCGVRPYSGYAYSLLHGSLGGIDFKTGLGGSGYVPNGIADNGDVYFYSPERLDGVHGVENQENLYLYADGHLQYVTTLKPERKCGPHLHADSNFCSEGAIVRMEVTPDDGRMAFVTTSQVTPYDSAGHLEMYAYTPATGNIVCVSCNPNGQPPTTDVFASQDGRFMTNDGRLFFSTTEALVPRDTNEGEDVYEYVDGRPQLITPGTGTATINSFGLLGSEARVDINPGLVGVSADGTDVYFSTIDTLLSEDHNGNFLRFYDARTGGGFPQPPPLQPCAAAEECHGPGTEAPPLPAQATAASLAGGNLKARRESATKHRKQAKKRRHHRNRKHRPGVGR